MLHRRRVSLAVLVGSLAAALAVSSCSPAGVTLSVDVRTDFAPGIEFTQIRTLLGDATAPIAIATRGGLRSARVGGAASTHGALVSCAVTSSTFA